MKKLFKFIILPLALTLAGCNETEEEPEVKVTSIFFNKASANLYTGDTLKLKTTVNPIDATNKNLTWSTSDKKIATVDNGTIKALKDGEVTITAKNKRSGVTKSIPVKVKTLQPEEQYDSYTVLIYMCGANLESDYANNPSGGTNGVGLAVMDIMEILSVPNKPDNVNIVIETGGAKKWTSTEYANYGDYDIDKNYLQIHHVEDNKIVLDKSLTKASMGVSTTLQAFIEYGLKTYPADKTGLVLWNHGGALQGVCNDENYRSDALTTTEVTKAVNDALSARDMSGQKLEWIGYDACLMSVQDIAEKNSQYFNYMVAAEETESGTGWDYDSWIDDLYRKKPTETILEALVDGFIADNGGINSNRNDQTLAFFDLRKMSSYKDAWENMSEALIDTISENGSDGFNNEIVSKVKSYAGDSAYAYGLFDAKDINKLSANSTYNPGETYINAVLVAHKEVVSYCSVGKKAGKSYGLGMYYTYYTSTSSYYNFTSFTNWKYICDNYGNGSSSWWPW